MSIGARVGVALLLVVGPVAVAGQAGDAAMRVVEGARQQLIDFEAMIADVARADVLFVGERSNDVGTHRFELALLEALARRRGQIILSLEMFDRDVQEPLDHYLMGHLGDAEFVEQARVGPEYLTTYKPLVDFAIARRWPVVAANAPGTIAAEVAAGGLNVLKTKPDAEQSLFARDLRCPFTGPYFRRFREVMLPGATPRQAAAQAATIERSYLAQCMRDETMGESIAQAFSIGAMDGKRPLVVHLGAALGSDFHEGVVERTRRRLPEKRMAVVSLLPGGGVGRGGGEANERRRGDYLVYILTAPRGADPNGDSSSSAP